MRELRNNKLVWGAALWAMTLFVLVPGFDGGLSARTTPKTNISHTPVDYFVPGFRIQVDALISDEGGVMLARCYFRAKGEADFVFVDMPLVVGNEYAGILPAPSESTEEIEYLLLAVNNDGVVVRSQEFTAKRADDREKPPWQQADSSGDITIKTEMAQAPETLAGFSDSIVGDVVESAFRFGYVAEGIYLITQMVGAAPIGAVSGGTVAATTTTGAAAAGGTTAATTAAASGGGAAAAGGSSALLYVAGGAALVAGGVYAATTLLGKKKLPVTITVWDSGADKDDTFDVYLDGEKLGTTSGPGYSQSWNRDLEEGSTHTVRVVCADDEHDNGVYCAVTISNSNQAGEYEQYMSEGDEFSRNFTVNESGEERL
jgi:hypothetical protein